MVKNYMDNTVGSLTQEQSFFWRNDPVETWSLNDRSFLKNQEANTPTPAYSGMKI